MDQQRQLILDQFTRQAIPFMEMHSRDDAQLHALLINTAEITEDDTVLDVACGPGLVACEIAQVARHVTGVDLTPAMIDQARPRQSSLNLTNLDWIIGDAHPLPFPDDSFSRVVTRYTFHHFSNPTSVFQEMVRVCNPGGRITVCDVFTTSEEQSALYDQLEKHRDPSHTHALQLTKLQELFGTLSEVRTEFYKYHVNVDAILSRSFPDPGGAEAFRSMVANDIGQNRIGIDASRNESGLAFAFPVVIVSGRK